LAGDNSGLDVKRLEKENENSALSAIVLRIARVFTFCFLLFFFSVSSALALDPNKRITQYGHTAWRVLDGYFASPTAIAQTTDGYIWIGTRDGVLRFDGVKFTPWTPAEGQALPGRGISALRGASDGSLWIGTTRGTAQLKDGQLINYPSKPAMSGVGAIIEDETGAVWFTRYRITDGKGPLCRVKDKDFRCFGKEDGIPVEYGQGLTKDEAGNIWIASEWLCRWTPESSELFFKEELKNTGGDGVNDVAVGPSGQVWAALDAIGPGQGVRHYSEGKWSSYAVPGFDGAAVRATALFRDRNNALWVGTYTEGVYRIHNGIADHYAMKNGLSGNSIGHIFEDREGNIWIQTDNGVDMFRDTPVVSFSLSEGLFGGEITSILGLSNGSIWIANKGAVNIIQPGVGIGGLAITTLKGLPGQDGESMLEDRAGRVWLEVDNKLTIYENNRFLEVKKPDGNPLGHLETIWAMASDEDDNVWVVILKDKKRHLLRIRGQTVQEDILLSDDIRGVQYLVTDRQGVIWIGSARDKLARYHNGQTEIVSLGDEGAVIISSLKVNSDDALWAATSHGMYRWKDGVLSLLDSRNGLPCSTVFSALEDDSGNLWLYARCGLLRVPAADVASWRANPESKVSVKIFDALDGALPGAGATDPPRETKSTDGRLWFINGRAAQMIDPSRSYTNTIAPPVYIEGLMADRKSYQTQGHINLPPLRSELEIDYTALSYAVPRKINFRYKLEGHDADWQDVGTRRQAFYNNLGPGQYRFQVIASNNDGVWNETGAMLDFTIEPTWYQTTAFRLLSLLLIGLIVWGLYRLRIRQISKVITARFDERLAERTRLARELHDTFIQTIQGSKMVADDALEQSGDPVHMRRAMEQLAAWLGQANEEGRAALNSLRTSATETNDLAEAFRRATEACKLQENAEVRFSVVGCAREMHPIVRDEIYRIGYEAIRNACQHSNASQFDVELKYAQDLSVRVKDNGNGIDPVVASEGKEGHFGLNGMRERAARIGAKLTIVSSANTGTEITLVVPGGLVFRKAGETPLET
jgi:signal transduction histidine kinase/ligand-binding sensor domain-containing protein